MIERFSAWIEIDTDQFRNNLRAIRRKVGNSFFCLPVKANAYGHGLCEMAKIAVEEGVEMLGVSCLQEAETLRLAGIQAPILLFGALHEGQIDMLLKLKVEFTISSQYKAELVAQRMGAGASPCRVHLEVDTGMRRTGVKPESVQKLIRRIEELGCFELVGIYSHLATAERANDPFAHFQIDLFRKLLDQLGPRQWIAHLANSGGVVHYPDSWLDMVRPGLLAYGYFPDGSSDLQGQIAPCLSLHAHVSYFKVVGSQEGISYGHAYRTQTESRIVTVPLGYGDGVRRSLWGKARVLIRGKKFPIAGAICMDQFMVDIGQAESYVGDRVTLIGRQGNEEISLWEIARHADAIPYEILCGLGQRLQRCLT